MLSNDELQYPRPSTQMTTSTDQPNTLGVPWVNTIVFANFFVFSFLLRYRALGTSTAKQGFVIRERVQLISVTESVWLLNLLYTYLSWRRPRCDADATTLH